MAQRCKMPEILKTEISKGLPTLIHDFGPFEINFIIEKKDQYRRDIQLVHFKFLENVLLHTK